MNLEDTKKQLSTYLPDLIVSSLEPLQQGWDSFAVKVNNEYIFRFALRPETEAQYKKESWLLPRLTGRVCLNVPMPVYLKLEPPPPLFIGYRAIPGNPLRARDLWGDMEGYADQLADFLKSLAEFPLNDNQGNLPVFNGDTWRNRYSELHKKVNSHLYQLLREDVRLKIDAEFLKFLRDEGNFSFMPVLIHGDLSSDHIIHDPIKKRITGVIDWGDSAYGDPAFDLTGILHDYGASFASRLLEAMGGTPQMLQRAAFYARLIPFYESLHGLETSNEKNLTDGLRRIETSFGGQAHFSF